MIYLTPTLYKVFNYIVEHPGSRTCDIAVGLEMTRVNVSVQTSELHKLGAVVRKSVDGVYRYQSAGKPVMVGTQKPGPKPTEIAPDIMKDVGLRKDQMRYILQNLHLPRRELAKQLGMTKLDLNYAMDKLGISSKFAEEVEEA